MPPPDQLQQLLYWEYHPHFPPSLAGAPGGHRRLSSRSTLKSFRLFNRDPKNIIHPSEEFNSTCHFCSDKIGISQIWRSTKGEHSAPWSGTKVPINPRSEAQTQVIRARNPWKEEQENQGKENEFWSEGIIDYVCPLTNGISHLCKYCKYFGFMCFNMLWIILLKLCVYCHKP